MRNSLPITILTLALVAGLPWSALAGEEKGEHEGHSGHLMVEPGDLEWQDVGSMPPGAKVAVLEGDPTKEESFTMRIEFPANYTIPLHTHPAVERVTVLEGTLYLGIGETFDTGKAEALSEGALAVMEPGVPMYGFTKDERAVIQLNGEGPWGIQYLNPAEDPRKQGG